jgi:tripeptidyl-peptidase I
MISNINAARIQKGKGPVGFLNLALYKHASKFINDVTVGNNKCVAGGSVCCKTGFHAAQGWDPTTGRCGTVEYSTV